METTALRLTYDGPALQTHTMDVRLLAPALLAFGDLAEEAARTLWGDAVSVKVDVRASFKTGSFGIELDVLTSLLQNLIGFLKGDAATAVANGTALLTALGVTGKGLIYALKWLRGRPIRKIERIAEGRRIITDDGDALEVEESVITLMQSVRVREHLWRVIEPIDREGIDAVAFGRDAEVTVLVEREHLAYFHVPQGKERLLSEEERTMPFSIVSLSFKEANKWRLHDGQNTVFVELADQDFLSRIDRNQVRFAKGDILIARTRILHRILPDGSLRTDYTLLHVQNHHPAPPQIELPLE